jgi:hypothetical protein
MDAKKILKDTKTFLNKHKFLIILISIGIFFSYILFFRTFGYEEGHILINSKIHSDFISHVHLIRSFSESDNFPPEYPLFSGEKSKYHFLFYMIVGLVERVGVRIDIALNVLSSIGFVGMLFGLYHLGYKIGRNKIAALLGSVLLLFNSSLSWIYYFAKNGFDLSRIWMQDKFASFGPYDDNIVSAFWNLNIFTNQRHLAISFSLLFVILYLFNTKKLKFIITAIVLTGIMAWLHKAMLVIIFGYLLLSAVRTVKSIKYYLPIILGSILAVLPAVIYLNTDIGGNSGINLKFGFIYNSTTWHEIPSLTNNILRWIVYWYFNLGFLPLMGTIGWIYVSGIRRSTNFIDFYKKALSPKSIWFVLAIGIFVVANTFTFAIDPATNHKLINFTIYILNIYAAIFIWKLFSKDTFHKIIAVFFVFILVIGGLLDLFPIINDNKHFHKDIQLNEESKWIVDNTDRKSTFLPLTYENESIRVTGRSIFMGWPYFAWSLGYDTFSRDALVKNMFEQLNKDEFCVFADENNLDYIYIKLNSQVYLEMPIPIEFFKDNFEYAFENDQVIIFDISTSCK